MIAGTPALLLLPISFIPSLLFLMFKVTSCGAWSVGKVPKVTAFMREEKCHWKSVLPSHVPTTCRKGEQAGGQHLPGEAGISLGLGLARDGPKPRPALNILAFLILLFLYLLTL